jgi:tetratricopeptide (TPR) repeat protein
MDFGIAHVASASRITMDVSTLGTAQYMSPEQATGMQTDARSDIFSIGTIFYEALSGENPFSAPHPMAAMYSITNDQQESLAERGIDIPRELSELVDRALAKEPDDRFASAGEFAEELSTLMIDDKRTDEMAPVSLSRRIALPVLILVLAAVISLWAIFHNQNSGDRAEASKYLFQALELISQDERVEAYVALRRSLLFDPRWEKPWQYLRELNLSKDEYAEGDAIINDSQKIQGDAERAAEHNLRISQLMNQNDPIGAATEHNMRAIQLMDQNDLIGAKKEYYAAIESDPNWEVPYNNLAMIEIEHANYNRADSLLKEALKRKPDYTEALYNMGTVKWELNELSEAERNLQAAINSDPDFIPAYNNLGSLLNLMERPQEAAIILDGGLDKIDSTPYPDEVKAFLLKNRGITAAALGDEATAETYWRQSLEILPGNEEVRGLLESIGAL